MLDRPRDLSDELVATALATDWGLQSRSLEYAPLGAGSYHWRVLDSTARRWFATADDLTWSGVSNATSPDGIFADLNAAFDAACKLRELGLAFVVAPVPASSGEVVVRVAPNWALTLFPLVDGQSGATAEWQDSVLRRQAAALIGRLHATPPSPSIPKWSFDVPCRSSLDEALRDLDRPWHAGPLSEQLRSLLLLAAEPLISLVRQYDALAASLAEDPEPWVLTHGEPHCANFIAGPDRDGVGMHLIDWDTLRLAPRERDLAVVVAGDAEALDAYQSEAGPIAPRLDAIRLFQARWNLTDIAITIRRLRRPHAGSEDDRTALHYLANSLQPENLMARHF